jgi:DNA-binding MarR family transcriptional regulator
LARKRRIDYEFNATAERYKLESDEVDFRSIQIAFQLGAASSDQNAAGGRLIKALGFDKAAGRFAVLRSIYFAPEKRLAQFEIGQEIRVSSANVSYLVDALERDGLVRRSPDPPDRRTTLVELTEDGIALCQAVAPDMARMFAESLAGFSEEEKRQFSEFLVRFRRNVGTWLSDKELA